MLAWRRLMPYSAVVNALLPLAAPVTVTLDLGRGILGPTLPTRLCLRIHWSNITFVLQDGTIDGNKSLQLGRWTVAGGTVQLDNFNVDPDFPHCW